MNDSSLPLADRTLFALAEGYAWLPNRMRETSDDVLRTRLLGRRAIAVRGPDAVRFFYDERHVRRDGAIPEPVRGTLFGHGAVHTLDGEAHRARKSLFLPLLHLDAVTGLVEEVSAAWEEAERSWAAAGEPVVLFDEAGVVLTRGVCRWAGVPLEDDGARALARDLQAMVDGFATLGPRHWRARRARGRQERWLGRLVEDVRAGRLPAPPAPDQVLARVAGHRDASGELLDPGTAAVELLNVIRPTVAVSWFVAFAAHALHRWPETRENLRAGDTAYATAFAHEVRRFYPFAPFLGGRAVRDLTWRGVPIPEGALVLLDVYGQNHDDRLWEDPYAFRPERFVGHPLGPDELIPQGGGDPADGHRCPGEHMTIGLLEALAFRLARLTCTVPEQDLTIPLHRIPTRPRSGFAVTDVRVPADRTVDA